MNRFLAAIAICAALTANASTDSIKVVKGQVSDYYIPVVTQYDVTGIVTDEQGFPLEGATVMWLYSPAHCNTDVQGRYSLVATDGDTKLCVHYPGKEMTIVTRDASQYAVNISLVSKHIGYKWGSKVMDLMPVAVVSLLAAAVSYGVGWLLHLDLYPDGLVKLLVYILVYMGWSVLFRPEAYTYFLTTIPKKFRFWERHKKTAAV